MSLELDPLFGKRYLVVREEASNLVLQKITDRQISSTLMPVTNTGKAFLSAVPERFSSTSQPQQVSILASDFNSTSQPRPFVSTSFETRIKQ